jgi:hypothetical protein
MGGQGNPTVAHALACPCEPGEDRLAALEHTRALVVVVADGAGAWPAGSVLPAASARWCWRTATFAAFSAHGVRERPPSRRASDRCPYLVGPAAQACRASTS